MMRLAEAGEGRDNHLNLIRMAAASAVLVSHAWPIALGAGAVEPLARTFGVALGTVAVYVFFTASGFLITRSFERTATLEGWIVARALRLLPGLAVVAALSAFALGPLVTALPLDAYFAGGAPVLYVLRAVTLVAMPYALPGVFADAPYPGIVNGSLWTLFHEVACYGMVMVLGLAGALSSRRLGRAATALYLMAYVWGVWLAAPEDVHPKLLDFLRLSLPFFLGALLYLRRAQVPLSLSAAAAGLVGAGWAMTLTPFAHVLGVAAIAYATLTLAFARAPRLLAYNRLGDFSYGVYIYAFPTQQVMAAAFGPMTPVENIALAAPMTLALAILSWRIVEAPALALRPQATAALAALRRVALRRPPPAVDAGLSDSDRNP